MGTMRPNAKAEQSAEVFAEARREFDADRQRRALCEQWERVARKQREKPLASTSCGPAQLPPGVPRRSPAMSPLTWPARAAAPVAATRGSRLKRYSGARFIVGEWTLKLLEAAPPAQWRLLREDVRERFSRGARQEKW